MTHGSRPFDYLFGRWVRSMLPAAVALIFAGMIAPAGAVDSTGVVDEPAGRTAASWTRQFGSSLSDYGFSVAVDASGVYVAGRAEGALLGMSSAGGLDVFIRKYDSAGDPLWTRQFGTGADDQGVGVAVDDSGVFLLYKSYLNYSIRKYDSAGNTVWTHPFATSTFLNGIAVDASGIYVAGTAEGDALVVKLNGAGTVLWTRQFGTTAFDRAFAVAVDGSGVYVAGTTEGVFPGQGLPPVNGDDAFVRKYDAAGTVLWTRQYGAGVPDGMNYVPDDSALGVAADATGVYIVGGTNGEFPGETNPSAPNQVGYDAYIRKYTLDGDLAWTDQIGTEDNYDYAWGVAADGSGAYVTGLVGWMDALPGMSSHGQQDGFVRRYTAGGQLLWTDQFGTAASEWGIGVAVGASGVYVTGATDGAFPGEANVGHYDVFLRQYPAEEIILCQGQVATIAGAEGDDTITGTDEADVIAGLGGDDTIHGLDGADIICGGDGSDDIYGGPGNDRIYGDEGRDRLWGENGDDDLSGGPDHDYIVGNAGKDILRGEGGGDALRGGAGGDLLDGGPGDDYLYGGAGTDQFITGPGDDMVFGEDGVDTLDYRTAPTGILYSPISGTFDVNCPGWGLDYVVGPYPENVLGSRYADEIHGTEGPNVLRGFGGKDRIYGEGGDDLLVGGAGKDTLRGGDGQDTAKGGAGTDLCRAETKISCEN